MCKALDEIYEKGQATGEVRGEARGIEKEKRNTIMNLCSCSAEYVEWIKSRCLGEALL